MNVQIYPNRDLLDPYFESYKLSLHPTSLFSALESNEIDFKSLKPTNFSRFETQLFSLHNALFQDRFVENSIYYFTKDGEVKGIVLPDHKNAFSCGSTVFKVPSWSALSDVGSICNASMQFTQDFVAICDGGCILYLLSTLDRFHNPRASWKKVLQVTLPLTAPSAYLADTIQSTTSNEIQQIDCLLITVEKNTSETSAKTTINIDWFTFTETADLWCLSRCRKLTSTAFPDYVGFDLNSSSISICSSCPFTAVLDSSNPDVKPLPLPTKFQEPTDPDDLEPTPKTSSIGFIWTQSSDSSESCFVNVLVNLQGYNSKPTVGVVCTSEVCSLNIGVDDVAICNADLFSAVRTADTLWTYDRETNSLDITMVKECAGRWPRLLLDVGEEERLGVNYDESVVTASGDVNGDQNEEIRQNVFNVEQLEDVDMVNEADNTDLILQRVSGNSMQTVVKTELLDFQWLYNAPVLRESCSKLLCTRHDVDGLVWGPEPESGVGAAPWRHLATLQAFGYVLASKRNRRFVVSPPTSTSVTPHSIPFVAVADTARHVYVYWQPGEGGVLEAGETELRHRRHTDGSSKLVHVAWQQVISLPEADDIIGFVATTRPYPACIVATRTHIFLISLQA